MAAGRCVIPARPGRSSLDLWFLPVRVVHVDRVEHSNNRHVGRYTQLPKLGRQHREQGQLSLALSGMLGLDLRGLGCNTAWHAAKRRSHPQCFMHNLLAPSVLDTMPSMDYSLVPW